MASDDLVHYFAYGSNMSARRLAARVSHPTALGAALLPGMRLACNKPGRDGTGKANIVPESGGRVWGVVFQIREDDLQLLDGFEPGYAREIHQVRHRDGRRFEAHTYRWLATPPALPPAAWYRDLILAGAREHDLPDWYQQEIGAWHTAGRLREP